MARGDDGSWDLGLKRKYERGRNWQDLNANKMWGRKGMEVSQIMGKIMRVIPNKLMSKALMFLPSRKAHRSGVGLGQDSLLYSWLDMTPKLCSSATPEDSVCGITRMTKGSRKS